MDRATKGVNSFNPNRATKGRLAGKKLRDIQIDAINFIRNSNKRFIAINAPTGSGKSLIAMEAVEPPFFYLCSSKHLQTQLRHDFNFCSVLWGRSNYKCIKLGSEFDSAGDCNITVKCFDCKYEEAKTNALKNPCSILNFAYFLTACNYAGFANKDRYKPRTVIIDEADAIENVLTEFISFVFNTDTLTNFGITVLPDRKTVLESFAEFVQQALPIVSTRLKEYHKQVVRISHYKHIQQHHKRILRQYNTITRMYKKLLFLSNVIDKQQLTEDRWVYYYTGNTIYLKPKWITRDLADMFLFNYGERFIFMSATLPAKEVLCGLFGIHPDEMDYAEFPSMFDSDNRPVFFIPMWSLSHKTGLDDWTKNRIKDEVLKLLQVEVRKGIIHTVNYQLSSVLENLSPRLFIHSPSNKQEVFEKFIKSKDGVFVSPSSIRGIDLPDDKARWVLFLKCPFPDLNDPLTSARCYSNNWGRLWYLSQCVQDIVQGSGRAVRHEKDWARVYVYDEKAKEILVKYPSLFPLWFREAIEFELRETMTWL